MEFSKPFNLLPQSYQDKYVNRYMLFGFGSVALVLAALLAMSYIGIAVTQFSIHRLANENTQYQSKQQQIGLLTESVQKNRKIVQSNQQDTFPFYFFLQTVENEKPQGLTILSIDSAERLVQAMTAEQTENTGNTESIEEKTEVQETQLPELTYEKDLSGSKLVVRGYSGDPAEVASFVDSLSKLPYVASTELKAIEEHPVSETEDANIFELILHLK